MNQKLVIMSASLHACIRDTKCVLFHVGGLLINLLYYEID